jgi:hypothetical protein
MASGRFCLRRLVPSPAARRNRPGSATCLVEHAEPEPVLVLESRARQAAQGIAGAAHQPPLLAVDQETLPALIDLRDLKKRGAVAGPPGSASG